MWKVGVKYIFKSSHDNKVRCGIFTDLNRLLEDRHYIKESSSK